MSYIINKTDGTVLTEVVDGSIDQTSTDITLIGKNSSTYGEFLNENFIKILENFASTSSPNNPIVGQLWYDASESRLKVYDGSGFKVSGGTIVSNSIPSSITQGDLWIDSYRQQLYFNDGTSTILAGPLYTAQQGISGLSVTDVLDTNQLNYTILILYIGQTPIGYYSKSQFVPQEGQLPGFTGTIKVGFTAHSSDIKFNVATSQADALIADDGTLKTPESFVSTTDNSTTVGRITILNETPLVLGSSQNNEIKVTTDAFKINSNIYNQSFQVNLLNVSGLKSALHVDAVNEWMGIYTNAPTATLDVAGDVRVRGDLTIEGNLTTINTTNLVIEDKLVELAKTDTPSNATADGGGILIEAGTDGDKTLTYDDASTSWLSSEDVNVATGKVYKINDVEVLSATDLGVNISRAYITQFVNTLLPITVENISIGGNTISYAGGAGVGNITISPRGTGVVSVDDSRIEDVLDPINPQDAATRAFVEAEISAAPLGLSVVAGVRTNIQIASEIINKIYPPGEHQESTLCRIWCTDLNIAKLYTLSSGVWAFTTDF